MLLRISGILLVSFFCCACAQETSYISILEDLYTSTYGTEWTNSTGWLVGDPCANGTVWHGVTCSNSSVVSIFLLGNNLGGELSSSIGDLLSLRSLTLSHNNIRGIIPSSYSALNNLEVLILEHNQLEGTIPSDLSEITTLKIIDLSFNALFGPIPTLTNMISLKELNVQQNELDGTLPEFASIEEVTMIELRNNLFEGEIPPSYGTMPKLETLHISNNDIIGSIPQLDGLQNLISLRMNNNSLHGTFPMPTNSSTIYTIDVSFNNLSGDVPNSLKTLPLLSECIFGHNQFSGIIPEFSFTASPLLELIDFSFNQISGPLPSSIGGIYFLKGLYLRDNLLSGVLPSFLDSQPSYSLDISNNLFDCPLPEWCSSSGSGTCSPCTRGVDTYTEVQESTIEVVVETEIESSGISQILESNRHPAFGLSLIAILFLLLFILVLLFGILAFVYKRYNSNKFIPLSLEEENDAL